MQSCERAAVINISSQGKASAQSFTLHGDYTNTTCYFTSTAKSGFTLDENFVNIDLTTEDALCNKDYLLFIICGGIFGDVQCNDTHCHQMSKNFYRDQEMAAII